MKVLIVRTAPFHYYHAVLESFKQGLNDIWVLTSSHTVSQVRSDGVKTISYDGDRLTVLSFPWNQLSFIRQQHFDCIRILHANYFGVGYVMITLLSILCGARRIETSNPEGFIRTVHPFLYVTYPVRIGSMWLFYGMAWCYWYIEKKVISAHRD